MPLQNANGSFFINDTLNYRLLLRMEQVLLMQSLAHRRGDRCLLVLEWKFIKVKLLASISGLGTWPWMFARKKLQQTYVPTRNKQVRSSSSAITIISYIKYTNYLIFCVIHVRCFDAISSSLLKAVLWWLQTIYPFSSFIFNITFLYYWMTIAVLVFSNLEFILIPRLFCLPTILELHLERPYKEF